MPTFYGVPSDGSGVPEQLADELATDFNTPGTVLGDVVSKYQRRVPSTIALLGDSFTEMSVTKQGVFVSYSGRGFIGWALQRLGHRLRIVARPGTLTGGVTGQTAAQAAARVQQDVIDLAPGYAHVLLGTNDVLGAVPFATTTAALTEIYDEVQGAGITLIVGTIAPKGGAPTTTQLNGIERLNGWIREQAAERPGVILADYHVVLAGPSGDWRDVDGITYTADETHPATGAAMRMGKVLADALAVVVPARNVLPSSNRDSSLSASTLDQPNIIANPLMVGVGGSIGSTGATGQAADSWVVTSFNGSGGNTTGATVSKQARDDYGPGGEWQVIDTTTPDAAFRLQQTISSSANLAAGDTLVGAFEYEIDALTDLDVFRVQIATFDAGNGYANRGTALNLALDSADLPGLPFDLIPRRGVIMTPALVYPATATGLTFSFDFSGVGRIRVARGMLRRVARA